MLNEVRVIGRLGADPEARGQNGSVTSFSVASTYVNKNGEKKTEWIRIAAFEKTAEFCQKYLRKGNLVYVDGRLQTRSYDKNGEKRYSTEVIARRVLGLEQAENQTGQAAKAQSDPLEDEIPF